MKLKPKTRFRLIGVLVGILMLSLIYDNYISAEAYIKRITGIELPYWTKTHETSNGEVSVVGKFGLPKSKVMEFASKYQLKKITDESDIGLGFNSLLREKNRLKKIKGNWMGMSDCTSFNSWKVLLNSDTGELWISVLFPDMAGDAPPCDKKEI